MPKGRRSSVPEFRWEEQKEAIRELYLGQKRQLSGRDGVIEIMRRRGFQASAWQYQSHLERWNFRKKLTSDTWHAIKHVLDQRKLEGLESAVYAFGLRLEDKKVAKETQRHKDCREDGKCKEIPLPMGVNIEPAQELALVTAHHFAPSGSNQTTSEDQILNADLNYFQCTPDAVLTDDFQLPSFLGAEMLEHQLFEFPESSMMRSTVNSMSSCLVNDATLMTYETLVPHFNAYENVGATITTRESSIPRSTALLLANLVPKVFGGTTSMLCNDSVATHDQDRARSLIKSPTHVSFIRHMMYLLMNNFAGFDYSAFYGTLQNMKQFSISQLEDLLDAVPAPFDAALQQGLLTIGIESNIPRIVRVLLERGIDVNAVLCRYNSDTILPLGLACEHLHLSVVRLLLERNVDVNRTSTNRNYSNGYTAIDNFTAKLRGSIRQHDRYRKCDQYPVDAREIFKCLLQAGARLGIAHLCTMEIWHSRSLLEIYIQYGVHGNRKLDKAKMPSLPPPPPYYMSSGVPRSGPVTSPPPPPPPPPDIVSLRSLVSNTIIFAGESIALEIIQKLHAGRLINLNPYEQGVGGTIILPLASFLGSLTIIEYCISLGTEISSFAWCEAIRGGKQHVLRRFMEDEVDFVAVALAKPFSAFDSYQPDDLGRSETEIPVVSTRRSRVPACLTRTPFSESYRLKNEECIQFFQESGVKQIAITEKNFGESFDSFMTIAVDSCDMQMLKFLADVAIVVPGFQKRFNSFALRFLVEAAVSEGHEECLHILLELGFVPTPAALTIAVAERNESLVHLLLNLPVEANDASMLFHAICWGNHNIIDGLLQAGVPLQGGSYDDGVSIKNLTVSDMLGEAMDKGNQDLVETLIDCGIRTSRNKRALRGSLLEQALRSGRDDMAFELLARGADANDPGALMQALSRSEAVFEALIDAFRIQYPLGDPIFAMEALSVSIQQRDVPRIRVLAAFTDLNTILDRSPALIGRESLTMKCWTLLGEGILTNDTDIVRALLDMGGDATSVVGAQSSSNPSGRILALSQAIVVGNLDMVKLLYEAGSDINIAAKLGVTDTPLQLAVKFDNYEITEFLLHRKVDPNAAPCLRNGANALQLAAKNGNIAIADLLFEHKADVNAPGSRFLGKTAFELAAENGRMDMLLWLYHHGLNICSDECRQIRNAMDYAEKAGQLAARDLVIQLAADVSIDAVLVKSDWDDVLLRRVEDKFKEDWSTWV